MPSVIKEAAETLNTHPTPPHPHTKERAGWRRDPNDILRSHFAVTFCGHILRSHFAVTSLADCSVLLSEPPLLDSVRVGPVRQLCHQLGSKRLEVLHRFDHRDVLGL
jgi:hypothetical protein